MWTNFPFPSQINSFSEEKRPMLFYNDWLVMEKNSFSSLTVPLASCKCRSTSPPTSPSSELHAPTNLSCLQWQRNDSHGGKRLERLFWRHHRSRWQTSLLHRLRQVSESVRGAVILWPLINGHIYSLHAPFICFMEQCPSIFLLLQAVSAAG